MQRTSQEKQKRIDTYLAEHLHKTRHFCQRLIEHGFVLCNDVAIRKNSQTIMPGDVISLTEMNRHTNPGILADSPVIELEIVHQTDDYLVIWKPKGVLSHPNSVRDTDQPSVSGFLFHYAKKHLPSYEANFVRSGIVHRLDKDTDGLMILALTEKGMAYFSDLFQAKSVAKSIEDKERVPLHKTYRAICDQTVLGQANIKKFSLPHYHQSMIYPNVPHCIPKRGITKIVAIVDNADGTSTLTCEILTGRTHQIRYHCAELGLPVHCDHLYNPQATEGPLGLTAVALRFLDPDGNEKEFVRG